MPVRFAWEYYAVTVDDMEKIDRNWDAINPDVGVVSVLHTDVERWGGMELNDLPSNSSMGVHAMRAYHSLHCLVSTLSLPPDSL